MAIAKTRNVKGDNVGVTAENKTEGTTMNNVLHGQIVVDATTGKQIGCLLDDGRLIFTGEYLSLNGTVQAASAPVVPAQPAINAVRDITPATPKAKTKEEPKKTGGTTHKRESDAPSYNPDTNGEDPTGLYAQYGGKNPNPANFVFVYTRTMAAGVKSWDRLGGTYTDASGKACLERKLGMWCKGRVFDRMHNLIAYVTCRVVDGVPTYGDDKARSDQEIAVSKAAFRALIKYGPLDWRPYLIRKNMLGEAVPADIRKYIEWLLTQVNKDGTAKIPADVKAEIKKLMG